VFGTMGRPGDTVAWSDADLKASDVIQQYWTNVAQTGNPNGGSLPEWPRYEPATARYLESSADGPVTNANIRLAHCGIFLFIFAAVPAAPGGRRPGKPVRAAG
jgi:para-nitrobenzyl esterase